MAKPPDRSSRSISAQAQAFLQTAERTPPTSVEDTGAGGRLVFALDATASREPTWDLAMGLQSEMFEVAAQTGGLAVQLVFYRGFRECKASGWRRNAAGLGASMRAVRCLAGRTQIGRILAHAEKAARTGRAPSLVFIGDACEESRDTIADQAGRLGLRGVKAFMFQEGADPAARAVFKDVARLTDGAYAQFNAGAADRLRALLGAVAAYASGGAGGLRAFGRAGGAALNAALLIGGPGGAGAS
ncbi:MAG: VWA domain-containing protein [Maricaulaceae bacterium]